MEISGDDFSADRRQYLQGLCALAALTVAPAQIWAAVPSAQAEHIPASAFKLLSAVCDSVIPRTDTPGAVDVGVPQFVALALQHQLEGTQGISPMLTWLQDRLKVAGGSITDGVTTLDTQAFSADGRSSPWHQLKALILLGYYTSKAGAEEELRYELVPGRFDPNIALTPDARNSSSDWIALTFG
jgi:hypothetical protein